jgi:hypothetical protein
MAGVFQSRLDSDAKRISKFFTRVMVMDVHDKQNFVNNTPINEIKLLKADDTQ